MIAIIYVIMIAALLIALLMMGISLKKEEEKLKEETKKEIEKLKIEYGENFEILMLKKELKELKKENKDLKKENSRVQIKTEKKNSDKINYLTGYFGSGCTEEEKRKLIEAVYRQKGEIL